MSRKRNREYWRKRFKQMEEAQNDKSMYKTAEIQEQFERSITEIDKKISLWYQRLADNNGISMVEAKKLLSDKQLKEFRWSVGEYIKYAQENADNAKWIRELENASARVHIGRLEALKYETQAEMEKLFGNYTNMVDRHIRDAYMTDYYHTAFEVYKGLGIGSSFQRLNERVVENVIYKPWTVDGKNFSDRIWDNKTKLINTIHKSLSTMCITGEGPEQAIKEIANAMNVSKKQAGTLVMTESAVFANKAHQDCMNELDVEEFEVVETLDSHTCQACADMDGKYFPLSQFEVGVTAPVFHPRCRGCTCPHFDDEFTIGEERVARNEEGKSCYVPSDLTYKEWEKAYIRPPAEDRTTARIEIGSVDMSMVNDAVLYFENVIRKDMVENAIVIMRDGRTVQFIGSRDSVDIFDVDLDSAIITHNHPASEGISSFGANDFYFLQNHPEIKELRCVNEKYNYSIKVLKTLDGISYNDIYLEGFKYIDDLDFEVQDAAMKVLQERGYVVYERIRIIT